MSKVALLMLVATGMKRQHLTFFDLKSTANEMISAFVTKIGLKGTLRHSVNRFWQWIVTQLKLLTVINLRKPPNSDLRGHHGYH